MVLRDPNDFKTPQQSSQEVRKLAVDELKADGIIDPNEQQINEKADAIQKQSATEVDVHESTKDSPEVGEGKGSLPERARPKPKVELTPGASARESSGRRSCRSSC